MKYILSIENIKRIKAGDMSPLDCCGVLLIGADIVWREIDGGHGWTVTASEKAVYHVRNTGNYLIIYAGNNPQLNKVRRASVDGINAAIIEHHMRYGL